MYFKQTNKRPSQQQRWKSADILFPISLLFSHSFFYKVWKKRKYVFMHTFFYLMHTIQNRCYRNSEYCKSTARESEAVSMPTKDGKVKKRKKKVRHERSFFVPWNKMLDARNVFTSLTCFYQIASLHAAVTITKALSR